MKPITLPITLHGDLRRFCESNYITPADVVRQAIGLPTMCPVKLSPKSWGGRSQTERFLSILSQLAAGAPLLFEKAAVAARGNRRLWFAKSAKEVAESGSSNKPEIIPGSIWYVSVNCDPKGLKSRIRKIMSGMGFAEEYIYMAEYFLRLGDITFSVADDFV